MSPRALDAKHGYPPPRPLFNPPRYEEAVEHFERLFRRYHPSDEDLWAVPGAADGGDGGYSSPVWGESLLTPDIFSFTHLLSALEKLGRDRACLKALKEMAARGVKVCICHAPFVSWRASYSFGTV